MQNVAGKRLKYRKLLFVDYMIIIMGRKSGERGVVVSFFLFCGGKVHGTYLTSDIRQFLLVKTI